MPLPGPGEAKRAILDTYTKEHSAEYQSQAPIDLARRMRERIGDLDQIASIVLHTSHHTHVVIGTGSNDPQKFDPFASRETLDHSVMYIFAVALQDGTWHHERSYAPERAQRPDTIELWKKIFTAEDPEWTRRYHSTDPDEKAFGARAEVTLKSGEVIVDELAIADAHPLGARPFSRDQYIAKFRTLTEGVVDPAEQDRFLDAAQRTPDLKAGELNQLTFTVSDDVLARSPSRRRDCSDMTGLIAASTSAADKRIAFRGGLSSGKIQRLPGAINPLTAKLIQEIGFEGVYVSGGAFSAALGLPDIGLTTLTEVVAHGRQIAGITDLPVLIDADTGFGEPMSAARTVLAAEDAGIAGLHLEDQVNPKRCGHLDGKAIVPTDEMVRRLRAAVTARRDPNFVICARTDAAGIDGIDAAIERAKAYADAGADLIFTRPCTPRRTSRSSAPRWISRCSRT